MLFNTDEVYEIIYGTTYANDPDLEAFIDAAAYDAVVTQLEDTLATPYYDEKSPYTIPLSGLVYDVEILKRTTARSRYVKVRLNMSANGASLGTSVKYDGTKNKLPMYKSYADDPTASSDSKSLDRRFYLTLGERLNVTRVSNAQTTGEINTFPVMLEYEVDDDPVRLLASYTLSYKLNGTTAQGWINSDLNGNLWTKNILFTPNAPGGRNECSLDGKLPYRALTALQTHNALFGIRLHGNSAGSAVLQITIPIPPALPSTSVVEPENHIDFIAHGETIFSMPIQWQTRNVVSNSEQRVEMYTTCDLAVAAKAAGKAILIPHFKLTSTGWTSSILTATSAQTGIAVNSARIKIGNTFFSTQATMMRVGNCTKWTEIVYQFSPSEGYAVHFRDPYITSMPEYQQHLIQDDDGLHFKGWPVTFKVRKSVFKCGFIQDPLGVGIVTIKDYDKELLDNKVEALAVGSVLLQNMVVDQGKRIEYLEAVHKQAPIDPMMNALVVATAIGTTVAPHISTIVSLIFQIMALTIRITTIISAGITPESVLTLAYDMYVTVALFRSREFSDGKKLPVSVIDFPKRIAQRLENRIATHTDAVNKKLITQYRYKLNQNDPKNKDIIIKLKPEESVACDVEHVVRPLESMRFLGSKFDKIAAKVANKTATSAETQIFHKLRDMNVLPMHNYLRLTSYTNNTTKEVNIIGVSDGYSARYGKAASAHLIGNQKFQAIKINSDGSGGIGIWRMKFQNREGAWTLQSYKSSGLEGYEILAAAGMSKRSIDTVLSMGNTTNREKIIQTAYELKSKEYLTADNHSAIKKTGILLGHGQFDVIHNAIRMSGGDFAYTLLKQNCQKVADDILLLLKNPSRKPNWMNPSVHKAYVEGLRSVNESSI